MKKIYKTQLFQIFHRKTIYVLLALSVVYAVYSLGTMPSGNASQVNLAVESGSQALLIAGAFVIPLISMLIITDLVTIDYTDGTMKNIICSGMSKEQIFFGKLLAGLTITAIVYVGESIIVTTIGTMKYGWGNKSAEEVLTGIALEIIAILVYSIIAYSIAIITASEKFALLIGVGFFFADYMQLVLFSGMYKYTIATLTMTSVMPAWKEVINNGLYRNIVIWIAVAVVAMVVSLIKFKKTDVK